MPRSYEFTCRLCGKTVTESADNEVCADCALSAGAPPPPPKPPAKKPEPPKTTGPIFTIRLGPAKKKER